MRSPHLSNPNRSGSGSASGGASSGEATPSGSIPSFSSSSSNDLRSSSASSSSSSSHPWASILGGGGGGSSNQIPQTPGSIYPNTTFSNPNEPFNLSNKVPPSMLQFPGANPVRHPSTSSMEIPQNVGLSKLSSVAMPTRGMSLSLPGTNRGGRSGSGSSAGEDDENFRGLTPMELRELMIDESRSFEKSSDSGSSSSAFSSSSSLFSSTSNQTSSSTSTSTSTSDPTSTLPLYPTSTILILDIRPSTSYQLSRVPGSINICAPSTLLKRAGIGVERLEEEMLSCEMDRKVFANWKKGKNVERDSSSESTSSSSSETPKKYNTTSSSSKPTSNHRAIIVLDASTSNLSAPGAPASGGGGKCLSGVLKKFKTAGYDGELCWLNGGFGAWSSWNERISKSAKSQDKEGELIDIWVERGPRGSHDGDDSEAEDENDHDESTKSEVPKINESSNLKLSKPSLPKGSIPSIAFPNSPTTANDENENSSSNDGNLKPQLMRTDSGKRRASAPSPTSIFNNPFNFNSSSNSVDKKSQPKSDQNLNPSTKTKKNSTRHHSLVQPRGLPLEAFSVLSTTNAASGNNSAGLKTPAVGSGWGNSSTGARTGDGGGSKSGSVSICEELVKRKENIVLSMKLDSLKSSSFPLSLLYSYPPLPPTRSSTTFDRIENWLME